MGIEQTDVEQAHLRSNDRAAGRIGNNMKNNNDRREVIGARD